MASNETEPNRALAPVTKGRVLHGAARYYDLLAALLTLGRERALRERLVDLAGIAPGDSVLDVGCGTGSLAIAAKRRVGATGVVHAVDASPEMIEVAKRKAQKRGADVAFDTAVAESLPFPDARFDVVLSTLMLHHLPRTVRDQCAREIRRVLKPSGRVLAVDFSMPSHKRRGLFHRMHRHGHVALEEIVVLLSGVSLTVEESGAVGVSDLYFALATVPDAHDGATQSVRRVTRDLPPLPTPRWVWLTLGALVLGSHAVVLHVASSGVGPFILPAAVTAGVAGLALLAHLGAFGLLRDRLRRRSRT